ncbi:hypothetical protein DID75_05220, partial [Candidatus Marinamargulisbacteria bacterium SCGC AG-410-N11]
MVHDLTDIDGVYANGICCGIKEEAFDLGYLFVPEATGSAAVFTRHLCPAACVRYTRKIMKHNTLKAIIVNSGNANAATGNQGDSDNK